MPYPPPYTYDDPRLTYDEHCFKLDGGYDEVCLVIGYDRKRRVGAAGAGRRPTTETPAPSLPWIDITVCAQLLELNDEKIEGCDVVTQGAKGELAPGEITLLASRTAHEPSNVSYVAEDIRVVTGNRKDGDPEKESIVLAEPITATQGGKFIPLANLRSRTTNIIFKTEVTSSAKQQGSLQEKEKVTSTTTEIIEHTGELNITANIVLATTSSPNNENEEK